MGILKLGTKRYRGIWQIYYLNNKNNTMFPPPPYYGTCSEKYALSAIHKRYFLYKNNYMCVFHMVPANRIYMDGYVPDSWDRFHVPTSQLPSLFDLV